MRFRLPLDLCKNQYIVNMTLSNPRKYRAIRFSSVKVVSYVVFRSLLMSSWVSFGPPWASLWSLLGHLGPLLGQLGPLLGHLGPLLGVLGPPLAPLEPLLGHLLGLSWASLGPSWATLDLSWAPLGLPWSLLAPSWASLVALLGHPGPSWVPFWCLVVVFAKGMLHR